MKYILKKTAAFAIAAAVLFTFWAVPERVHAASASIEFSKDTETVRVGDVMVVTMRLQSDIALGEFEGSIQYDDNQLEFVTGPECISGGAGMLRIRDTEPEDNSTTRDYLLYFKALKIGSGTIGFSKTPEVYDDEMGYLMSVSSGTLEYELIANVKASSDATLAALKISKGKLTPDFDTSVHEYTVSVDNETEDILVTAIANDDAATVKIEGNKGLAVGQNRVLLLVTAEDGTKESYVIYVARAAASAADDPEGNTGDSGDGQDNAGEETQQPARSDSYFYVTDEDDAALLNVGTVYRICTNDGSITIPDGYYKTSIIISGHTVTAYSPTEDLSSDFLLLILAKDGGEPELYSFDRVEKTVQRFEGLKKGNVISNTGSGYSTLDEQQLVEGYEKSMSSLIFVIAVLCGICMLLLILTIRMALKNKRSSGTSSRTYSGSRSNEYREYRNTGDYSGSRGRGSYTGTASRSTRSSGTATGSRSSSGTGRYGSTGRSAGSRSQGASATSRRSSGTGNRNKGY